MNDARDGQADAAGCSRSEETLAAGSRLFQVFLQEQDRLRRIVAGMGMAGADIDDVLQDVSLRVLQQGDQFRYPEGMTGWLIRTTVNGCLTEHRRRFRRRATKILRHRPDLEQAPSAGTSDAGNQAAAIEEREIVRRTMTELEPSLLELLVLRYFGGLDSNEIARALDLNASTVRCRLRDARMILAQKLMRRGVEP
jgi:RNA polymerase sigma-70 factor (ECF subfamily)